MSYIYFETKRTIFVNVCLTFCTMLRMLVEGFSCFLIMVQNLR